jgi:hypothetical protein
VPEPDRPTENEETFAAKLEPAPVTTAVPTEPKLLPTAIPPEVVNVPPSETVNAPVAILPTCVTLDSTPALVISGAFVVVSIMPSTVVVGTPPLQFPGLNQSLSTAPVQLAAQAGDDSRDNSTLPRAKTFPE